MRAPVLDRLSARLSRGFAAPVLIALIVLIAALPGVFSLPVLDRDEARYAQATAQMLATDDFVSINFLDEERNKKPVGIHWMQAAAVTALTGEEARQIWAYRVPSVIGALLAALGTFWIGRNLLGARGGLFAGSLMAATVLLGAEAGIAKTDAMLAGLTTLALFALLRLRRGADDPTFKRRAWAVAFWGFVGLGTLVKGPVTPLAAGMAAVVLVVWEAWAASRVEGAKFWPSLKSQAGWLRPLAFWPGPLLAILIVVPWLVSVQIATDGAFLREALGDDLGPKMVTGDEGHGGPPGYHLLLIPLAFLPAVLFLPSGIAAAVRALRAKTDLAFAARVLIAFSLPVWLLFELLPTKLPHYVLPAYPALAVLCAWGIMEWAQTKALWRWIGAVLLVLGAFVWTAAFVYLAIEHDGPAPFAILAGAGLMGLAVFAALASARGAVRAALLAAIALGLVWHVAGRGVIAPMTNLSPGPEAARLADQENLRPDREPVWSTYTEPSLVFTFGGEVTLLDIGPLRETLDASQPGLVVIDHSRAGEEDAAFLAELEQTACASAGLEGYNYSRGRPVRLTLHRIGPCTETTP
ncbi:glycosyltransferase family 39 protein [Glycocaulis profundi]|nr:glycosyltransferase family 39 protein [Glycocaulis profundi]